MDIIVRGDIQAFFDGAYTRESCRVVLGDHSRGCGFICGGLIDDLDRPNVGKVGVGVDYSGNPFEILVRSLVLVVHVEPGRRSVLPGERLSGLLCTRGTVQVEDDIESGIFCPTTYTLEIGEAALGEVLAVLVNDVLINPIAERNTNGIKPETGDLGDIFLGNPASPMCLEGGVGCTLPEFRCAVELAILAPTAHLTPFFTHHPWLNDEPTAKIDPANFSAGGEPSVDQGWETSQSQSVDQGGYFHIEKKGKR